MADRRPQRLETLLLGDAAGKIAGYYSLSAASSRREELPPALAKRLPHYPVPAAILGRLAVGRACQGQGLGETLLLDAVRRVVRASATLMVHAVIVDAKTDRAEAFYERYGFRTFASIQRRLFLPLETFEKLGL
ncbi:MAG: GNAT family N-acetyltransferase [Parvibaculaceae bacterium]